MAKGDVVFAVDTSRYVSRQELKKVKRFLRSIVKRMRFKRGAFSVGLVQFSDWSRVVMDFDQGNDKRKAKAGIARLRYLHTFLWLFVSFFSFAIISMRKGELVALL